MASKGQPQQSDMAGLLGNAAPRPMRGGGCNQESAQLNLDHLTTTGVSVSPASSPSSNKGHNSNGSQYPNQYYSHVNQQMSLIDFMQSYISMLCHYYPKLCACCTISLLLTVMTALALLMLNPTTELGMVGHHESVRSKHELSLSQVDHWCLRGGNDNCRCEDPLVPLSRAEHLSWLQAHELNVKLIDKRIAEAPDNNVNIAFVGESVIEAMAGRWMGSGLSKRSVDMMRLAATFEKNFFSKDSSDNDALNGVALGIAGDTAPNVLWRLQNGELPDKLQPKIFWISLGMNDLARMQCSEEIVVLGILRVVEEILERRPNSYVVINSVFPMGKIRGGSYPVLSDYRDAFKPGERRLADSTMESSSDPLLSTRPSQKALHLDHRQLRRRKGDDDGTKPLSKMTRAERAQLVEEKRDKAYRRRHRGDARRRKRPVNPKLQKRQRVRKHQVRKRRTMFPFWVSINAINGELQRFAQAKDNDRVHFFDSTDIFLQDTSSRVKQPRLNSRLITLRGHPTPSGFSVWEQAIQKQAKALLQKMRATHPDWLEPPVSKFQEMTNWLAGAGGDDSSDDGGDGDGNAEYEDSGAKENTNVNELGSSPGDPSSAKSNYDDSSDQ